MTTIDRFYEKAMSISNIISPYKVTSARAATADELYVLNHAVWRIDGDVLLIDMDKIASYLQSWDAMLVGKGKYKTVFSFYGLIPPEGE